MSSERAAIPVKVIEINCSNAFNSGEGLVMRLGHEIQPEHQTQEQLVRYYQSTVVCNNHRTVAKIPLTTLRPLPPR